MTSPDIYKRINDNAIAKFKPTWLYVKQHSITGIMYFGKTTKVNKYYRGSGKDWLPHINEHGTEYVVTLWEELFTDIYDLVDFATFFSEFHDIVNSKLWANRVKENGLSGGNSGHSEETKILMSQKQRMRPPYTDEQRKQMCIIAKARIAKYGGRRHTPEEDAAASARLIGRKRRPEDIEKSVRRKKEERTKRLAKL